MLGDEFFQTRAQLGTALFALSTLTHDLHGPEETVRTLNELGGSLREPFLFVVVGEVKAGKSSLLNAIFGQEFCRVDVLPATDKIYVFKYDEKERDVPVSAHLTECYRPSTALKNFNIVDTPGTNTIVADHEIITRQFLPLADLCMFVISATNPWSATAWSFLEHIHRKWLKKVVFVLQQSDLRSPEEVATIIQHMEQTMLQKIGERCPIIPVSARNAWAAHQTSDPAERAERWNGSGLAALEQFIAGNVTAGEAQAEKLRSVCRSAQVILVEHASQVRTTAKTLGQDTQKLEELRGSLAARKEQSIRQIGGAIWTLAQNYERISKRGEELLREKLTLVGTFKLMLGRGGWERSFQTELEERQRASMNAHVESSLELIQTDLKSVWKQVHELMQRHFADQQQSPHALPDFERQRKELLDKISLTLIEKSDGAEFESQMRRLFTDTGTMLRIPAGILAAGGIGAVVAAALMKLTILDITGTIAGIGAVTGTVFALARRKKIIAEYGRQMAAKRDTTLQDIEDHLRHAINRFYLELEQNFQPLEAFCAAQKNSLDPHLTRIRELEDTLGKCSAALSHSARPLIT